MNNYNTIPVKYFIIKNENTGKTYEYFSFDKADEMLNKFREEHERAEINMYALIDA